ncbi:MAG: putative exosome complex component CSL4 [Streblomastix strix]|uniref:Putative exosome complex component CSL4 n=1 Tax=Streblomastix strix TaxID=222440 RepID=A0A5J4X6R3_9EUKA|nr:MAG: putative exosome complex component CSL4 [Streblomastix strix]
MEGNFVIPGQKIGQSNDYLGLGGTYTKDGQIFSSLSGLLEIKHNETGLPQLTVVRKGGNIMVPSIGAVVLCRAVKITKYYAQCLILSINEILCEHEPFPALIRKQDVRMIDIDKIEIQNSFRPGDLIRAKVISLGDSRFFFLKTNEVGLGVVYAISDSGNPLIPISYNEMIDTSTGNREFRKVAKLKSTNTK